MNFIGIDRLIKATRHEMCPTTFFHQTARGHIDPGGDGHKVVSIFYSAIAFRVPKGFLIDTIKFQLTQDRCEELENFQVNDTIKVTFNLKEGNGKRMVKSTISTTSKPGKSNL